MQDRNGQELAARDDASPPPPRAGFLATLRAVLWSFIGVRRRHDHDARSLDPRAIVAAALLAGLVFVLTLVAVVRLVVSSS